MRTGRKADPATGLQGRHQTPHPGRPATTGQSVTAPLARLLAQSPNPFGDMADGWTVDLLRPSRAQHTDDVRDATGRRQLQAGGWV